MTHKPVLLQETLELLDPKSGDIVLDCTVGAGGHAMEMTKAVGKEGVLIGLDQDQTALDIAKGKLSETGPKVTLIRGNFRNLDEAIKTAGVGSVDRILFDLGMSSMQIEESGRGFSFLRDEPLLMTLSTDVVEETTTAKDVVNDWSEASLSDIIYGYGGERFAKRIAREIVNERKVRPIETSAQLAEVVERAVPGWYKRRKIHPATKTFQAIRIAVNDELGALEEGLGKAWGVLKEGGRIAVVSFHELEDRIVKNKFKNYVKDFNAKLITKKPVVASREEVLSNPRSRSAKLRVIKK